MKLYDAPLSGNCYKIRLLLALLDLPYERIAVDLKSGRTRTPELLALNPRGQVPILVDDETVIWDSQAILVYLARRYGAEAWFPSEPEAMAGVMQWLAVSENELLYGLARARRILRLGGTGDIAEAQVWGREGLMLMETHLGRGEWLAMGRPTIADVACYPYVKLAPEAGFPLEPFPSISAWLGRVETLPGFTRFEEQ